jgi:GWxTD domain-containing protein
MSRAGLVLTVIAGVCLLVSSSISQNHPSRESLRLMADLARYRGSDDENTMVEISYALPETGITYRADTSGFSGTADIALVVTKGDSSVFADRWLVPHSVRDTASLQQSMNLVGIYKLQLREGDYQFKFVTRDRNDPLRRDSLAIRLPVRRMVTTKSILSDVSLASVIRQGAKGGIFYKNTLDVVPNVGGVYPEDAKCFYYAEAYNLLTLPDTGDIYIRSVVFDAVGKELISRERPRKKVSESTVIIDQFPVKSLRTGTYTLVLTLLDQQKTPLSTCGRKFFVYNQTLGVDSGLIASAKNVPMPEYMSMDEAELDREFRWCKYVVSDAETKQFEELKGVEAKRSFLTDFWRRRQPGEREEYMSRVAHANANFTVMAREGYRGDRGRVTIMYGFPDDIERHPNETDMRPYEIWSYHNIQGGVIFVFVQRNQAGDYELVHSTHRNELQDANWDRVGITR